MNNFYSILFYPITLEGRRCTTDEFATIPFHHVLFSAVLVELAKSIPVYSLILSAQLFFCLPLFLFPFTVPFRVVLALSTYPVLLCFLHCLLNPPVCFPVFFCSFCFISLLLQISPLITEVENIFGNPWLFPAAFLTKYLTDCISHCCIVGGIVLW